MDDDKRPTETERRDCDDLELHSFVVSGACYAVLLEIDPSAGSVASKSHPCCSQCFRFLRPKKSLRRPSTHSTTMRRTTPPPSPPSHSHFQKVRYCFFHRSLFWR